MFLSKLVLLKTPHTVLDQSVLFAYLSVRGMSDPGRGSDGPCLPLEEGIRQSDNGDPFTR